MTTYPTRRPQRLAGFDYTTAGVYHVTLCVQDRLPLFGHVLAAAMHCSPAGEMVEHTVHEVPSRYPGVLLDTVMLMPDHLHVLLSLNGETASLSDLIHWFKSQSTARYARGVRQEGWRRFAGTLWQRGFYDRVVRTDEELDGVREYVMANPARWAE